LTPTVEQEEDEVAKKQKKIKDLDPKGRAKNVKGGDLGRDIGRVTKRDLPRVTGIASKTVKDGVKGVGRVIK
jgi:hypothetical protein